MQLGFFKTFLYLCDNKTEKYTIMKEILEELRKNPKVEDIDRNKFAGNSEFLKIGAITRDLQSLFGLYQWEILTSEWSLDGLSFVVVGRLTVTCEGNQYSFDGIASKKIGDPHKDIPAINAYCFKNACKHLGNRFGAYLNKSISIESKTEDEHIEHMKEIKELDRLGVYYNNLQPHEKTAGIKGAYKNIKMNLNK